MKRYMLLTATVLFLSVTSSAFALSLTLENQSKFDVHELYFSPINENNWGPDQLGDEVIASGESFTLTKIAKGDYDVKIVDEDGDACEIKEVDFRATEHFTLTDKLLVGCQVATADEHESEEEE